MACRLGCVCAVLVACLLGACQGEIETNITKSLIGLFAADSKEILPAMYVKDAQCDGYIDSKDLDVCHNIVSSVTVLVKDKLPPDIKIELELARRPRWAVKIYRTTGDCAGEANVTVSVTCQK